MLFTDTDIDAAVLGCAKDVIRAPHGVETGVGEERVEAVWSSMGEADQARVIEAFDVVLRPVLRDLASVKTGTGKRAFYSLHQIREVAGPLMDFEVVCDPVGNVLNGPEGDPMVWGQMDMKTRSAALSERVEMVRRALEHMDRPGRCPGCGHVDAHTSHSKHSSHPTSKGARA